MYQSYFWNIFDLKILIFKPKRKISIMIEKSFLIPIKKGKNSIVHKISNKYSLSAIQQTFFFLSFSN